MGDKEKAQDMLLYYLRLASKGQNNIGGADNQAEIEAIITWTIEAATQAMEKKIKRLEARINDLESYHN